MKITANTIKDALATKHSKDVFVTECKTGPSQYRGCPRLDAWAMNRSWANALVTGYEIKVDRSDFLNDKKWRTYLPYCNEFYFVCPPKLIDKAEVGEDVGLMYISSTGTRIYTKKKARYRDVEIPRDLYTYILMCRTVITGSRYGYDSFDQPTSDDENVEFWKGWLDRKKDNLELGCQVSKKLQRVIGEEIENVGDENKRLKAQIDGFEEIREMLVELDIRPDSYWLRSNFKAKLTELQAVVPKDLEWILSRLLENLGKFQEELKKVKGGG